ncbi:MAG TPA: hypothetical protein VLI06_10340 [Solimonas sp.]|nr:hypothetical protein [Solimonas sp.]
MTRTAARCALLLLSALVLSACASRPMGGGDPGGLSEVQVVRALTAVGASDPQRREVLAAYDAVMPRLRALQSEREVLRAQLQALSPRQPDYAERVRPLARQWGESYAREIEAFADYEAAAFKALGEERWQAWREHSGAATEVREARGARQRER